MAAARDLARAGTMQLTAQEGKAYLDKNLTEWKKPHLLGEEETAAPTTAPVETSKSKAKLAKHSTMISTAKEAEQLLGSDKPDQDAQTRGQQKQINVLNAEAPPAKKSKLARDSTMAVTAKEGEALLGGSKLGGTRDSTKSRKSALKRVSTTDQTAAEAKAVYGDLDLTGARRTRSGGVSKPALKRDSTMAATAKEGKKFLKKTKAAAN